MTGRARQPDKNDPEYLAHLYVDYPLLARGLLNSSPAVEPSPVRLRLGRSILFRLRRNRKKGLTRR